MARKKSTKYSAPKQNELLLPSLALSMLALVLVGALVSVTSSSKTPQTSVSADSRRLLTKGTDLDDLEADLLLLQEDSLESEISVLEQSR